MLIFAAIWSPVDSPLVWSEGVIQVEDPHLRLRRQFITQWLAGSQTNKRKSLWLSPFQTVALRKSIGLKQVDIEGDLLRMIGVLSSRAR